MLMLLQASQKYKDNADVSKASILGPALLLLYINDLLDGVICNTAIYDDDNYSQL